MSTTVHRIRDLLRPVLPQKTFEFLQNKWWFYSCRMPRAVKACFKAYPPDVRGFGARNGLVQQLQAANQMAWTETCRVMTRYGSDKGFWHNYAPIYSALFLSRRNEPLRIFELGLGTNNPELASTMGADGRPGASLRGWRELFPLAQIFGADIDHEILFEEERIKTFYCDQLDPEAIRDLWSQPELQDGADILIEDGLHTLEANLSFMEGSLERLRPDGIYVVEDIYNECVDEWYRLLESVYAKRYPDYEFAFIVLTADWNNRNNNLLVIRRPACRTGRVEPD
jgi:SAM-dependent methyltransferase